MRIVVLKLKCIYHVTFVTIHFYIIDKVDAVMPKYTFRIEFGKEMTIFYKKNDNCKYKLTSTYVWIPIKTYFIDKWEATDEMYISMELGLTINCKLLDYIEAEISWNYLIRFVNSIVMDCCYCYYPTNWEYMIAAMKDFEQFASAI